MIERQPRKINTHTKKILQLVLGIVFLNFIMVLYIARNLLLDQSHQMNEKSFIYEANKKIYSFENPELAYKLLTEIDSFEPLPKKIADGLIDEIKSGIIKDSKYCDKVRYHFTMNSENLFNHMNIMSDEQPKTIMRTKIIPAIGKDMIPKLYAYMKKGNSLRKGKYSIPIETSIYYMHFALHHNYYLGANYGCLNQMHNHIYDNTIFNKKSLTSQAYLNYLEHYKNKPYCVPKFMPDSFLLANKTQCLNFFKYIDSPEYIKEKEQRKIVFFKKIAQGVHRGKGVTILDQTREKNIKKKYSEGELCGIVPDDFQMQKYVSNLVLLNGHKFDFRVYMLIASTNPLIVYYHHGFLKLSVHRFDDKSNNRNIHISNTHLAMKAFEKAKKHSWLGMNETELRAFQTWTFQRLQDYLIENGYTNDPEWIENDLKKQFKIIMIHIIRMSQHFFLKRSQSFELFGCDFVLDTDLKVWFIEGNTTPLVDSTTFEREKILTKMLKDLYELMFGYLRSRMKRVIMYINKISKQAPKAYISSNNYKIASKDYPKYKTKFNSINTNYLEPEFIPSNKNGFQKIIDENSEGLYRYSGLLTQECI